jgi:F0F1-type ATP synthase assembly protein I
MLRRSIAGGLGLAMLLGVALVASAADKDKDKDVKTEGKEVKGEIAKIDKTKMTFKVETEDGKVMEFRLNSDFCG